MATPRNPLRVLALIALIALGSVVFMGKSYETSLQAMDSSLHARLALEVTSNGPLPVLPMRNLETEKDSPGFNDHPFMLFYLNGWAMRALGANAWSARLLPSSFALGSVLLLVWLGTLLYSPAAGLAAGLILAFTADYISYGARFQLDPALVFFILLSFIAWWKKRPVWAGVAAGVGLWMKSPVCFLLIPSVFVSLLLTRQLTRQTLKELLKAALIALLVGSVVWIISGAVGGWDMVFDYWKRQVLGTAVGGRGYQQVFDPFFFFKLIRHRYWPWLILLVVSLILMVRGKRWKTPEVALPLSAALVVIVVISAMRFKFDHYYLPVYPFLALLAVDGIRDWIRAHEQGFSYFLIGAALVMPAVLLAMPIDLAPEMFPALRRFEPIIQSYGSCRDRLLYIEGQEPYGSFTDYGVELQFYTNRKIIESSCAEANHLLRKESPSWIIVSGQNLQNCLSEDSKARYPIRYQFGTQYLLSNLVPSDKALDLTPLARDLQAPLDCEPAALPKNRYSRYE